MKKSNESVAERNLETGRNLRTVPRLSIPSSAATDGFCISDNPQYCTTPSMAPPTPYGDMDLHCRSQQCNSAEGGGSTSSVDSRRDWDSSGSLPPCHGDRRLPTKPLDGNCTVSEDRGWSSDDCKSQSQKRLKIIQCKARGDDHSVMAESNTVQDVVTKRKCRTSTATQVPDTQLASGKSHPKGDARVATSDNETDAVLHAASALVSLSTDSGCLASGQARTSSSAGSTSSCSPPSDEAGHEATVRPFVSDDAVSTGSSSHSSPGRGGVPVSGSSVLSRPSHKRRYRLVAAVLAASPRISDSGRPYRL